MTSHIAPIQSTTIDRAAGDSGILIAFDASDSSGFDYASFQFSLYDNDGNWVDSYNAWLSEWDSFVNGSGSIHNGSFVGLLDIPKNAEQGTYVLDSFRIRDRADNEESFHRSSHWHNGTPTHSWDADASAALGGIDPSSLSFSVTGDPIPPAGGAPVDTDLPAISNLKLSSSTINRAAGDSGILIAFDASDSSGFDYASFQFSLYDNDGNWVDSYNAWLSEWDSFVNGSGSIHNGSFVGLLDIPKNAEQGTYVLDSFRIRDRADNEESFHRSSHWHNGTPTHSWDADASAALGGIDPSSLSFSVTGDPIPPAGGAPVDTDLPAISNLKLSSSTINRAAGDSGILIAFDASDSSGFDYASFQFSLYDNDGNWVDSYNAWLSEWDSFVNGSGSIHNGSFVGLLDIPKNAEQGTYVLDSFRIRDRADNEESFHRSSHWHNGTPTHSWDADASAALGGIDPSSLSFSVTGDPIPPAGGAPVDTDLPAISNLEITSIGTITSNTYHSFTAGEPALLKLQITDAQSGLTGFDSSSGYSSSGYGSSGYSSGGHIGELGFTSPDGSQQIWVDLTTADWIDGDQFSGTYQVDLNLQDTHQPGLWSLIEMDLEDDAGNELDIEAQSSGWGSPLSDAERQHMAARLGLDPSSLSFIYDNPHFDPETSQSDHTPPQLTDFAITQVNPQRMAVTLTFNDESGLTDFDGSSGYSSSGYGSSGYSSSGHIGELGFTSPDGSQQIWVDLTTADWIDGDQFSGTYQVDLNLQDTHQPGLWSLIEMDLEDDAGNELDIEAQSSGWGSPLSDAERQHMAARLGLDPSSLSFIYDNPHFDPETSQSDHTPPQLTDFAITQVNPQRMAVTLTFNDESGLTDFDGSSGYSSSGYGSSGYSSSGHIGELGFTSPDGSQQIWVDLTTADWIDGDQFSGTYQVDLNLQDTHQPGLWSLIEMDLEDDAGNELDIEAQSSGWGSPLSDAERQHMAARLGLDPSALTFIYDNPHFNPETSQSDNTPPAIIAFNLGGESDTAEPVATNQQLLKLSSPSQQVIRSGTNSSTSIAYNVAETNKQLTGISPSLYFDSHQVTVDFTAEPYQSNLLGYGIAADASDGDNDPATDFVIALSYTDFLGNFPGSSVNLPLTLADLNITPTENYTGTTLNLTGSGATGFEVIGDSLTLGYDAAPSVANPISPLNTDALHPWSYSLPTDLFFDPDSSLSISVDSDLPNWLSYDPNTFTFSGTPGSAADSLTIDLSASDALGGITTSLDLSIRDVQKISIADPAQQYQGGKPFSLPLIYSSTDGQPSTGLSFQLHYDSSLFTFVEITDPISEILGYSTSADTTDADNNPQTDTVLNVAVSSFTGALASDTLLGHFNFSAADLPPADPNDPDPIAGLRPSVMNLTALQPAIGYGFAADPITLEPLLFNLDVDGDEAVTALGDGLMIIRKLFGAAFAGASLTNKAISPNATRTTQEVHDYIQSGIDSGFLDVDQDGQTTALGDGLMIIRRLFGAAFSGSSLTNKAISPTSPYMGDENPWEAVATNIDDLIPN